MPNKTIIRLSGVARNPANGFPARLLGHVQRADLPRSRAGTRVRGLCLNQSQSGIYIDTGLGSTANTVIPAFAGIQGTLQNLLSWTPACAGVTKDFVP